MRYIVTFIVRTLFGFDQRPTVEHSAFEMPPPLRRTSILLFCAGGAFVVLLGIAGATKLSLYCTADWLTFPGKFTMGFDVDTEGNSVIGHFDNGFSKAMTNVRVAEYFIGFDHVEKVHTMQMSINRRTMKFHITDFSTNRRDDGEGSCAVGPEKAF